MSVVQGARRCQGGGRVVEEEEPSILLPSCDGASLLRRLPALLGLGWGAGPSCRRPLLCWESAW